MYILEMTYLKMGEKRILFFNISGNTKIIYTLQGVSYGYGGFKKTTMWLHFW